jgi:recombination protein RecT
VTNPNPRQQPAQQHVAVRDEAGQEIGPQQRAIEHRRASIRQVGMIVKDAAREFERLLPEHISAATFMTSAGAALWKSQDLMDGAIQSPEAFLIALRESAMLGHVPGTDHYYLTPRKEKQRWSVLGIEGYQGIIERMYRSGGVLSVHAEIVRANDTFMPYSGPNGRPLHEYGGKLGAFSKQEERGEIIGVYAYAMLPGGVPSEVIKLSMEDLMTIRAFAATPRIWNAHPIPMFKKSALRRLEPFVPVSSGYRQSAANAQAFIASVAPQMPVQRMEDNPPPVADADDVPVTVEGTIENAPDKPVNPDEVTYDPKDWAGEDPGWEDLAVARPGQGVAPDASR